MPVFYGVASEQEGDPSKFSRMSVYVPRPNDILGIQTEGEFVLSNPDHVFVTPSVYAAKLYEGDIDWCETVFPPRDCIECHTPFISPFFSMRHIILTRTLLRNVVASVRQALELFDRVAYEDINWLQVMHAVRRCRSYLMLLSSSELSFRRDEDLPELISIRMGNGNVDVIKRELADFIDGVSALIGSYGMVMPEHPDYDVLSSAASEACLKYWRYMNWI